MENKEIVGLTTKEIVEKIATEKFNLNKMRLNHAVSPLENPQRLKEVFPGHPRRKSLLSPGLQLS